MAFPCGSSVADFEQIERDEMADGRQAWKNGIPYYSGASAAWRAGWVGAAQAKRSIDQEQRDMEADYRTACMGG